MTSQQAKPLSWFMDRINKPIYRDWHAGGVVSITVKDQNTATMLFKYEAEGLAEYRDAPEAQQPKASNR